MSDIEKTAEAAAAAIGAEATKNFEKPVKAKPKVKADGESVADSIRGTRVKAAAAEQRWGALKDLKGKLPKGPGKKPTDVKKPAPKSPPPVAKTTSKPGQKPAAKPAVPVQPPKASMAKMEKPTEKKPAPKPIAKPKAVVPKGAVAKIK